MSGGKKINFKLYFVLLCMLVGTIELIIIGEWFTSHSLIETILLMASLTWLALKFSSSKIIFKYQNSDYHPTKKRRRLDDIKVNIAVHIILPICLDLLYACSFLMIIKNLSFVDLDKIAQEVYNISDFNKEFIKFPLMVIGFVIGILTLIEYISEKTFKSFKKYTKLVTFPSKVITFLLFFVSADNGIRDKTIDWRISQCHPRNIDKATFDACKRHYTPQKAVLIKEIIQAVTEITVDKLIADAGVIDTAASIETFCRSLTEIPLQQAEAPYIKEDLAAGLAGGYMYYQKEEQEFLKDLYRSSENRSQVNRDFTATTLYNAAYSKEEKELKSILDILNDERNSIRNVKESTKSSIYKEIIGDIIGKTYFFEKLPEKIRFYDFAKDGSFDFVKEKVADVIYDIINHKEKIVQNIKEAFVYMKNRISPMFEKHFKKAAANIDLVNDYCQVFKRAAIKGRKTYNSVLEKQNSADIKEFRKQYPHHPEIKEIDAVIELCDAQEGKKSADLIKFKENHPDIYIKYKESIDEKIEAFTFEEKFETFKTSAGDEAWEDFKKINPKLVNNVGKEKFMTLQEDIVKAEKENTIKGWKDFLKTNPGEPYISETRIRIKELEEENIFRKYMIKGEKADWREYLRKVPNSVHKDFILANNYKPDFVGRMIDKIEIAPPVIIDYNKWVNEFLKRPKVHQPVRPIVRPPIYHVPAGFWESLWHDIKTGRIKIKLK